MKKNKRAIMAISFCLGALMLGTTAFADVASKTGYEQFKDAIKFTSGSFEEKLQSYTLEGTISIKDNDKVLVTSSITQKVDIVKNAKHDVSTTEFSNGKKENAYYYRDSNSMISYNPYDDTYYVTEYNGINNNNSNDYKVYKDPFQEEQAGDMEKIFDALVGNLKDYVAVEEKADGSKEFSGTLGETQIPPLVNAVSSFAFKQSFSKNNPGNQEFQLPEIANDVFVRKVSGQANVNKDGIVDSLLATGILSGRDKDGNSHDLTVEILAKVVDINSTPVTKPDLSGKKVEKNVAKLDQNGITMKFIGKYKNDIVIIENDSFVKIGERVVEIVNIDDKHVAGRYYEQYEPKYAQENGANEFTFDAEIMSGSHAEFDYTNASGKTVKGGNISFDPMAGRIYFHAPFMSQGKYKSFDASFGKVFEQ